jgi:PadR family transcriptional regulator, regulatory protein PadR
MMPPRADLLQGSLDLLILKCLLDEPMHGWAIAKRLRELSDAVLEINQGSLYPALYRLEDRAWVDAAWGVSAEGRKVKVYRLTAKGRKQLEEEREQWRRFSLAVNQVLRAT